MSTQRPTLADRLWARTKQLDIGCWEWQGYRTPNGYGQIGQGPGTRRTIATHRAAWIVTHGPIPDGLLVLHSCDNRPCVNPAHLRLGTHQDNSNDALSRNRVARGTALKITKLTDEQCDEIRAKYVRRYAEATRWQWRSNAQELAAEYGISPRYVMSVVHRHYRGRN